MTGGNILDGPMYVAIAWGYIFYKYYNILIILAIVFGYSQSQ